MVVLAHPQSVQPHLVGLFFCFFAFILATFSSSRHTGIPMDLLAGIGYACAGLLAVLAAVLLGMAYRLGLLYQLWHKVG